MLWSANDCWRICIRHILMREETNGINCTKNVLRQTGREISKNDELINRTYHPLPSDCFVITDPKHREVFAAHFRDRIVHHLYFNYTHEIFERTFIQDSYSCIKGRGTHYGINRLRHHILKESHNYTRPCFVLKMDIRGYFMSINRHVLLDPTKECRIIGSETDWDELPYEKSMFHSPVGCGLPIGNLTSQLFSNVYLNVFDQFMKRELHCCHYGRYVDDFYVVCDDKEWLCSLINPIKKFLMEQLCLSVHDGKTQIIPIEKGVEYLGAFVLPYRIYVSRSTLGRMDVKLKALGLENNKEHICNALNSYCGVLSHWQNYNIRRTILLSRHGFTKLGMFDYDLRHYYD